MKCFFCFVKCGKATWVSLKREPLAVLKIKGAICICIYRTNQNWCMQQLSSIQLIDFLRYIVGSVYIRRQNCWGLNGVTLRTESPSIFLDKSGRGRNLCQHPRQFILSLLQIQILLRRQSNGYRSIHCVCQQI